MGLPIWRDPEEPKQKRKSILKADPTAAARSSIRRRPSVHGSRSRRLTREPTIAPPRFERSPPPVPAAISARYSRRNGVPPISTLLEHAQRNISLPPPPPPVPHSRNYYTLEQRERQLRESLDDLHAQAARLRRDAQDFIVGSGEPGSDPWTETERRTLLETATAAQSRRPHSLHGMRRRYRIPQDQQAAFEDTPIFVPRSDASTYGTDALDQASAPRSVLPTPPLEMSEPEGDSLFLPQSSTIIGRPSHPLSRSWRADSPVNGLGDRNRSPTPADAWEIMESTIEPDTTLPSAESSFAADPATSSFASSNDTTITEPERGPFSVSTEEEQGNGGEDSSSDSASSVDLDCTDEEYQAQAEAFAREMYYHEMATPEGRARIRPMVHSSHGTIIPVDVGFRLLDEALDTEEGRERVSNLHGEDAIHRMVRFRDPAHRHILHSNRSPPYRPHSPPATSQDPPSANPVSPPSRRDIRDISDVLLNDLDSDEPDLDHMRRVARRLAMRDDVPDEWWASMGINVRLNSSLAGPRHHRRSHRERVLDRVRGSRVERSNARL